MVSGASSAVRELTNQRWGGLKVTGAQTERFRQRQGIHCCCTGQCEIPDVFFEYKSIKTYSSCTPKYINLKIKTQYVSLKWNITPHLVISFQLSGFLRIRGFKSYSRCTWWISSSLCHFELMMPYLLITKRYKEKSRALGVRSLVVTTWFSSLNCFKRLPNIW